MSAEGTTEQDYLRMNVFKNSSVSVKFPQNIHPEKRDPIQVLKRYQKQMKGDSLKRGDEAWLVVDVDTWRPDEMSPLLAWARIDPRHHLAISNPKFELFLVMHFETANGCTTPEKVDQRLKRYVPRYNKRLSPTQFNETQVQAALDNAKRKRASCGEEVPAVGMTDAHLLVEKLLESCH